MSGETSSGWCCYPDKQQKDDGAMTKMKDERGNTTRAKSISVRTLKHSQVLRLKPVRDESVTWEVSEDGLVRIESKRTGLIAKLLGTLFRLQAKKRIQLDELGSLVWLMCDGKHTIGEMAQELMNRYKLDKREAEVSLITFIQQLIKRRLITVPLAQPVDDGTAVK
ncbi:MAG: PqqD family protein [Armatimonadota bacterium]|nr:PqqD family protein [Armatimonadota bacterium]MCX7778443.1 PqqD family protein [Armatimonadota bacterium]MDW8026351.1 PqqD family protein [Armatimonadota bacterium]